MEVKIQSIHFDATEKLQAFIPATALNKETSITVTVPGGSPLYVAKTCDTFEEGVDQCVDSLRVQLEKFKEKIRKH